MVRCYKCGQFKAAESFCVDKRSKTGRKGKCKECDRAYYQANKSTIITTSARRYWSRVDEMRAYHVKYNRENCAKKRAADFERYQSNPKVRERAKAAARRWEDTHPDLKNAASRKYKVSKSKAVPKWLNAAQYDAIKDYYRSSNLLNMTTGEWHEVDHIIPIRSKVVCGLHVPWNLQILPRKENMTKGNRVWPDMP